MSIRVYPLFTDDLTSKVPQLAMKYLTASPENKNCRRTQAQS